MSARYLRDLVQRATTAANRIVVFCTLAEYEGSDLGEMQDTKVFAFLNQVH